MLHTLLYMPFKGGALACWFPRNGWGDFSTTVPGWHFLAPMQILEMTLLKPSFVDFVISVPSLQALCSSTLSITLPQKAAVTLLLSSFPVQSHPYKVSHSAGKRCLCPALVRQIPSLPGRPCKQRLMVVEHKTLVANTSSTNNWCTLSVPPSSPFPLISRIKETLPMPWQSTSELCSHYTSKTDTVCNTTHTNLYL